MLDTEQVATGEPLPAIEPIRHRWKFMGYMVVLSFIPMAIDVYLVASMLNILLSVLSASTGDLERLTYLAQSEDEVIILYYFLYLISIVSTCFWIHRANSNLHLAGLQSIDHKPGMAVGWFFIPMVNLFMSYKVMAEIDRGSQSISQPEEYSSWKQNRINTLLPFCFFSFLASFALFKYVDIKNTTLLEGGLGFYELNGYIYLLYFYIAAYILKVFSGITLILYTRKITKYHNNHIELTQN